MCVKKKTFVKILRDSMPIYKKIIQVILEYKLFDNLFSNGNKNYNKH